jgi:hypothetical protein
MGGTIELSSPLFSLSEKVNEASLPYLTMNSAKNISVGKITRLPLLRPREEKGEGRLKRALPFLLLFFPLFNLTAGGAEDYDERKEHSMDRTSK